MSEPKFDVGDVVRIVDDEVPQRLFRKSAGKHLRVIAVHSSDEVIGYEIESTDGGWALVIEDWLEGVPLEEVRWYYADKPRDGFIVDGLTVDEMLVNELEAGQEEAYQTFRTAAKEANREEERRAVEEDRRERKTLAELTVTVILWAVCTLVSLVMWLAVMWTSETVYAPIGYLSTMVSALAVAKPMAALIFVCRERTKERKKRSPRNME